MREETRIWPQKALAALSLLLAAAPVCVLLGRYFVPDAPLIWVLPPCVATAWGAGCYLLSGKKRAVTTWLGIPILLGLCAVWLLPRGIGALVPLVPCALLLILLPPAYGRAAWEEWPMGLWAAGVALHLLGQYLAGKAAFSGVSPMLGPAFAGYTLLMLLTLNRQSLREGMHGASKAPPALRRRNRLLVLALFALALLAACWGLLGQWVQNAWEAIKRGLAALLNFLAALFSRGGEEASPGMGGGGGSDLAGLMEPEEPSFFAQLMEKIFMVLACAAVVAAAGFALYFLYKKLRKLCQVILARLRRYAAQSAEDYVDEAESTLNLDEKAQALRGKLRQVLARPPRQAPWEALDGRARVRRLYRQYLKRRPDVGEALTAREALAQEKAFPRDRASAFAELYEKARYSEHPVKPEDADALRREIK